MRVVELVPSLDVGGAERMAALLARGLHDLGQTVTVVSLFASTGSWIEADLRAAGVEVRFLDKRPGLDPRMILALARVLRALHPDVVHTHLHTLKYAWPASLAAGRPAVVHTVHNLAEHEVERVSRVVHGAAFRAGVVPVAIGGAVARSLEAEYGRPVPQRIPNGIPVAAFRPAAGARAAVRAELGLGDDDPVWLTAGRLNPQKNHAILLEAFARVGGAATLLIAGEGELRDALHAQAAGLGVGERVRFLGVRGDLPRVYAAADAFVLASSWEGNPLVVMEAMAAGLPIVATAVGCVPELVPAEAGALVPPGDAAALAAALTALLADPAAARRQGAAAAALAVARFDAAVMARAYFRLFSSLVP